MPKRYTLRNKAALRELDRRIERENEAVRERLKIALGRTPNLDEMIQALMEEPTNADA